MSFEFSSTQTIWILFLIRILMCLSFSGLRPFQCQLCKKGYTNKVQLLAHLRKIHAAECEVVDFSTEAVI